MTEHPPVALKMRDITKKFLGTIAVNNVDFDVRAGEVHALMGENGAGKSTLMKILAGSFTDYTGQVLINGKEVTLNSPSAALENGVGMIYQELSLAKPISIAENVLMGRLPIKGKFFLDKKAIVDSTRACLEQVGLKLDPLTLVDDISQHEAQLVEISKVLWHSPAILVMDEPTSALSREDTKKLFEIIDRLKSSGLAIIYISHHIPEVFTISDRVTVLRDGKKIGTRDIGEVQPEDLVKMMVGQSFSEKQTTSTHVLGKEAFRIENLTRYGFFRELSFDVKHGEVIGIGGLSGSGRTELARAIVGLDDTDAGDMFLDDKKIKPKNMLEAVELGIAYLSEDRKNNGLSVRLTVSENLLAALIPKHSPNFFYQKTEGKSITAKLIKNLNIQPPNPNLSTGSLSGGNQQKVLLAKWLATDPKVLILDEPTRGVDIGAKQLIHDVIQFFTEQDKAVILISSDLPELVKLSHRIMIMRKGHFLREMQRSECSEEAVLMAANAQDRSTHV